MKKQVIFLPRYMKWIRYSTSTELSSGGSWFCIGGSLLRRGPTFAGGEQNPTSSLRMGGEDFTSRSYSSLQNLIFCFFLHLLLHLLLRLLFFFLGRKRNVILAKESTQKLLVLHNKPIRKRVKKFNSYIRFAKLSEWIYSHIQNSRKMSILNRGKSLG